MTEIRKMNIESENQVADRIEKLKELFPEVATEGDGSIDFEKLRLILGDAVDEGDERYAFTWPGKADAIRQAQTVSTATLRPCPEKSVNWDTTQNLYIEGDNLEVLKLLQRGYHGKVKMIYIDPPYNTGHDFVYHDSFGDSIENYREQAGLSGQSNADTTGRYHSNWCSMMYPRLKLARELLCDDGVIFISIDDNEEKNLRSICDEVFGPQNFIATLIWEKKFSPQNDDAYITPVHDYILVYARRKENWHPNKLPRTQEQSSKFSNPDNDPRGPWSSGDLTSKTKAAGHSYPIVSPSGKTFLPPAGRQWAPAFSTYEELRNDNRLWFGSNGNNMPRQKQFLSEMGGIVPTSLLFHSEVGHNQEATQEVKKLFEGSIPFDTPKPIRLMSRLLAIAADKNSIILDFFSGSASMGHAVMKLNAGDNGFRRFIMVQLPERTEGRFSTICEAGEERIRRAGKKIAKEIEESNRQLKIGEEPKEVPDIGFRVLRLDESGIARPEPGQLVLDRVKPDRTDEDIVFEMMLKWGIELTYPIERTEIGGYPCYSVAGDALICCMQEGLTVGAIQAIADRLPSRVLMLDSILDDTLKLNAVQIFKRAEEKHQVTIDLRTV